MEDDVLNSYVDNFLFENRYQFEIIDEDFKPIFMIGKCAIVNPTMESTNSEKSKNIVSATKIQEEPTKLQQ